MIAAFAARMAQWPELLIVLSFSGVVLICTLAARALGARILPEAGRDEHAEAALDTFKVLGPLAGIFIIFCLVQSIGQFHTAEAEISREAATIYHLGRELTVAPAGALQHNALVALRDYVDHVVHDEWAALRAGTNESPAADKALIQLQHAVEALMAQLPADVHADEIDKALELIEDYRADRLEVADGGLPAVMWWVLALLFGLIFVGALYMQGKAARHPLPVLYVTGLGLLAALLFIFDRPFQGEISLSPAPLEKALRQMDARLNRAAPPASHGWRDQGGEPALGPLNDHAFVRHAQPPGGQKL